MSHSPASQPDEHNVHPVYRPDIDGLRAVAILSVVIFHAFPVRLPGGFVGVDVFFVISGFLISTIIFRSLQHGDFSFTEFYAHRIKRIFPALIVVLMACYAFGWFALLPDEFKQLGKHMAAGAGFIQNFILWQEVGYFDTTAELKPLLHLWSLAIEEQFYLIYPVLIFTVWWIGFNVLPVVLLLGLISFGLTISGVIATPTLTFFMPQTRVWELLAGSVLAYLQFFKRAKFSAWMQDSMFHPILFRHPPESARRSEVLNNILSVVGLLLLVAAVFLINKSKLFPGWWALLPVSGASLLILAGPEAWGNRVILANKLMVFVGLISYPLYLWHWPILSFARIVEGEIPSREIRIAAVALSLLLAWLTYRLIEKPIRFGINTWIKTAALTVSLALVGYVGYNAFQREGLGFRPMAKNFSQKSLDLQGYEFANCISGELTNKNMSWCKQSKEGTIIDYILWGDSHAEHLFQGLKTIDGMNWLLIGRNSCPPLLGVSAWHGTIPPDACRDANKNALEFIVNNNARIVVLASLGPLYFYSRGLAVDHMPFNDGREKFNLEMNGKSTDKIEIFRAGLQATVDALLAAGKTVVIIKDVPEFPLNPKACFGRPFERRHKICDVSRQTYNDRTRDYDKIINAVTSSSRGVYVFDAADVFCDNKSCKPSDGQHIYFRDGHHLSAAGSDKVAKEFMVFIRKIPLN